jgi:hypothetical protein
MKQTGTRLRRRQGAATGKSIALTLAIAVGCGGDTSRDSEAPRYEQTIDGIAAGPYMAEAGVLYRGVDGRRTPVLALPGAGAAADTLSTDGQGALGEPTFRRLVLSPDSQWVAWEVAGAGSWVGVAGPDPAVRVLDRWAAALPDALIWAPTARYLAVRLKHPDGHSSLELFDVGRDGRLPLPWDDDCAGTGTCDVTRVRWLGGTLLNVEIRLGPDEPSVPFEVNAGELGSEPVESEEVRT